MAHRGGVEPNHVLDSMGKKLTSVAILPLLPPARRVFRHSRFESVRSQVDLMTKDVCLQGRDFFTGEDH
jgi:hypothetical protein